MRAGAKNSQLFLALFSQAPKRVELFTTRFKRQTRIFLIFSLYRSLRYILPLLFWQAQFRGAKSRATKREKGRAQIFARRGKTDPKSSRPSKSVSTLDRREEEGGGGEGQLSQFQKMGPASREATLRRRKELRNSSPVRLRGSAVLNLAR